MLIAQHFDTGPVPTLEVEESAGAGGAGGADVSLGAVAVESLEIDKLKVAGGEVTGDTLTAR